MRLWAGLLGVLGIVAGNSACWRSDVFAVTSGSLRDSGSGSGGRTDVGGGGGTTDGSGSGDTADGSGSGDTTDSRSDATDGQSDASDGMSEDTADGGSRDQGPDSIVCSLPMLPTGNTAQTLRVGSANRSYVLHIPPKYDGKKPVPLILDFHGIGSSGASEADDSPYPAVTDPEGVVMAFPDGQPGLAGTAWNMGPCCVEGADDVGFARALVDHLKEVACIDAKRIYAVGILTGGGMVYYLACRAADVFAAVAPAAFDLLGENVNECNPSRAITVVSFRGNGESRVPYAGGPSALVPKMPITFLGAVATFQKWAQLDKCTGSPSTEDSHGCSTYSSCQDGVEVTLCTKQGGKEDPGDATVAWPMLKRHPM
jgi:polyhydroxybutyrate depolymerase